MKKNKRILRYGCSLFLALILLSGCRGGSSASETSFSYDRAVGWAVGGVVDGYGVILCTRNGGATWERQGSSLTVPGAPLSEVKAVNTHTAWIVGENSLGYGTILKTTDGGVTWVRQGSPSTIPDVELFDIRAVNEKVAWAVGGSGVILHTTDGGATWLRQGQGQVPEVNISYAAAVNEKNAWVTGGDDTLAGSFVYRTGDGGATWARQDPENEFLKNDSPIDMFALDASTAWIVGTNEMALETRNGGQSWENVCWHKPPTFAHANGICAFDADTFWVAADYNIMHFTKDGGATWTDFSLAEADQADFWLLRVTGYTPQVLWVSGANPRGQTPKGGILHTRNGGATWSLQSLPVDTNLRGISFAGACR